MEKIQLAHGSGGKLSQDLFLDVFQKHFSNQYLNEAHDGAILELQGKRIAFSTDSFVVSPLFFPGGNIGDLAINGTVNDLAMCGAKPYYLSAGFIIEEGLEMDRLIEIVKSMEQAALKAGILLVTGDTKVVENGSGDGVYINTAGIGVLERNVTISPKQAAEGDVVIINGKIADHGITIMSKREGLEFETEIVTDSAPLNHLIDGILDVSEKIHVLRDPTRGGIAATLNEIAESSNIGIVLQEEMIPISEQVKAVSSILGLDPLYIANEGKVLVIVKECDANRVLDKMKSYPEGRDSVAIGKVISDNPGRVIMKTKIGTKRVVDMPVGNQLPRIC